MTTLNESDDSDDRHTAQWDLNRFDNEHAWRDIGTVLKSDDPVANLNRGNYRYKVKRLTCLEDVCMGTQIDLLINSCGEHPSDFIERIGGV